MATPKIVGIETEYANFIEGANTVGGSPERAALLVLAHCEELAHWGASRHGWAYAQGAAYCGYRGNWGCDFASNGARVYEDHFHVEYSTQECRSARDLVACVKAGDAIVQRAAEAATRTLPQGRSLVVLANNADGQGNSYAGHLNVALSRPAFDALFERRPQAFYRWLIPSLVSSPIIVGAGKVGAEHGTAPAPYQLSQRADFIETAGIHAGTTAWRPLVNSRDEPLADRNRFARLHLIPFDTNRMEWALYLKIGITQLLAALLEDALLDHSVTLPDLTLQDPVGALHAVSRDLSLRLPLALESGKRLTALQIQAQLAQAVAGYVERGAVGDAVPQADAIVAGWLETLALLERRDFAALAERLDWVAKLMCVEAAGLALDDPRAKVADLLYADLNPQRSLYHTLFAGPGRIRRVTTDEQAQQMQVGAPRDTRAFLRCELLRRFPENIAAADWHRLTLRDDRDGWWRKFKQVDLDDPGACGAQQVEAAAARAVDAVDLCQRLGVLSEAAPGAAWGADSGLGYYGGPYGTTQ